VDVHATFEFSGGPLDGTTRSTRDAPQADRDRVNGWLWVTNYGQVGKRFWTASTDHADQRETKAQGKCAHFYEIAERRESEGEIVIRARYHGTEL
jgi:hypothetical protein